MIALEHTETLNSVSKLEAGEVLNASAPELENKAKNDQMPRLKKLQHHHDICEARYETAQTELLSKDRKMTLQLLDRMLAKETDKCSSDSTDTVIIQPSEPTYSTSHEDGDVPQLKRTDSVSVTKEMLGISSDDSITSIEMTEDEYVPDSAPETEDMSSEEEVKQREGARKTQSSFLDDSEVIRWKKVGVHPGKSRQKTRSSSSSMAVIESSDSSSDKYVSVMELKKKGNGGRVYNKKHYCLFCCQPYSKMARHLESKHGNKVEVARAVSFPKGSKERKMQLNLIRNKGNRLHNNEVLKEGKGMIIPSQQASKRVKAKDYLHCIYCEALLKRKAMWRHMKRCKLRKECGALKPGRTRVQSLCASGQPVPDKVNRKLWELVNGMNQDQVTDIIREEKYILKLGEHFYNKHGTDKTKHEYIRQKMREMGRLMQQARTLGKLKKVEDFFVPANFIHVLEAAKMVSGFDEDTNSFKIPSLALKLGHSLTKIADIAECDARMSENKKALDNVLTFKQLKEKKWEEWVSAHALRNLSEAKWNKPLLLPFTEDVKSMHIYLDGRRTEYQTNLQVAPNKKNWSNLAKVTLCEVIVFNRRREGEVSKMALNDFMLRNTFVSHPDVELALNDLEKKLCKHFKRLEIKGKRGRKVPILLTPDMVSSMEMLVKYRRKCGVPDENPFLFGRPEAETHLRGSDAIRAIALECGAKHPEMLSSTKLRKHMATMSKVLNLRDNEMDDLADFLGHDIRVHRQYYRLPEGTLQLAKISKVLMALERGEMSKFKGMNLDDINIDPDEEIAEGSCQSGSEDEDVTTAKEKMPGLSSISSQSSSGGSRLKKRKQAVKDVPDSDLTTKGMSRPVKKTRAEEDKSDTSSQPTRGRSGLVKKTRAEEDEYETSLQMTRDGSRLLKKTRAEQDESDTSSQPTRDGSRQLKKTRAEQDESDTSSQTTRDGSRLLKKTRAEQDESDTSSQTTRDGSRLLKKTRAEQDESDTSSQPTRDGSRLLKKTRAEQDESDTSSQPTRDSSRMKRKKWSIEEVQAVEKKLMHTIKTGKVPGKAQCVECIQASPEALQGRSWEAVKFYVKNRIDSWKRQSAKKW